MTFLRIPAKRVAGYILPMTLSVLALVALGAAYVAQRADLAVAIAVSEKDRIDNEFEISSAIADILYRLATQPRIIDGLGSPESIIHLDGRLYGWSSTLAVSLQDARGLLNINTVSPKNLQNLLATYGIAASRAADLYSVLQDYIDADDLIRLNGAEVGEYAALNLPPPRNAMLTSPRELRAMPRWKDARELWGDDPFDDHIQAVEETLINPVNATWRVLSTVGDLDSDVARRIVQERLAMTPDQFVGRLPKYNDASNPYSSVANYPSETVIVTLWLRNAYWGYRYSLTHANYGSPTPWRIDYAYRVERKDNNLPDAALATWPEWRKAEHQIAPRTRSPF